MYSTQSGEFITQCNRLLHECDSAYHQAAAALGMSDNAFWILYVIRLSDHALTQKEISELFFMPKQTVHSALRGFIDRGLLALDAVPDRRDKAIRVTPEGDRFLRGTVDRVIDAERRVFARLPEEDTARFLQIYRTIADGLGEELTRLTEGGGQ